MNYPMRPDLKVDEKFPDFELPDHTGSLKKRVLMQFQKCFEYLPLQGEAVCFSP